MMSIFVVVHVEFPDECSRNEICTLLNQNGWEKIEVVPNSSSTIWAKEWTSTRVVPLPEEYTHIINVSVENFVDCCMRYNTEPKTIVAHAGPYHPSIFN